MDTVYNIERANTDRVDMVDWDLYIPAKIDNYPWDANGYKPEAYAKVVRTENALMVKLEAMEQEITCIEEGQHAKVWQDSCLEFFLIPDPLKDSRYLNFELNPKGALHLAIGADRHERSQIWYENYKEVFHIKGSIDEGKRWSVVFEIGFPFIKQYYPQIDFNEIREMRGNFYKCGDKTKYPHFGCWNKIVFEKPDFHRPEYFGKLLLSK